MTVVTDTSKTRRTELILRQVDSLPTMPAIAVRAMALAMEQSPISGLLDLIEVDPAMSARLLAQYFRSRRPQDIQTISVQAAARAVGNQTVYNVALTMPLLESNEKDEDVAIDAFDSGGYWLHSMATAVMARNIATIIKDDAIDPQSAYTCGLLHDIGKLTLRHRLPKGYRRVVEMTQEYMGAIAEYERQILGIDHHTAGKRLAEEWSMPHRLQDCVWLHGSPYGTLPDLRHRRLVGLVSLANMVARLYGIGFTASPVAQTAVDQLAEKLGIKQAVIDEASDDLKAKVEARFNELGLNETPSEKQITQMLAGANQTVGRLNDTLLQNSQTAAQHVQMLDSINAFHAGALPGRSVQDVVHNVVASARALFGQGSYCVIYQPKPVGGERQWMVCQYDGDGQPVRCELADLPEDMPDLNTIDPQGAGLISCMQILPWIAEFLKDQVPATSLRLLPLSCGWGTAAMMVHTCPTLPPMQQLSALTSTWGAAIAAARQHEGARRLGEDLAQANTALAEAQDKLLESESMARLGEMAAGAAHEMNNPLAVISGRSQLLARALEDGSKEHTAAVTIAEQSHRLSNLITLLRFFADPPMPHREQVDLSSLMDTACEQATQGLSADDDKCGITLEIADDLPEACVDPNHVQQVVVELLQNALESKPKKGVTLAAKLSGSDRVRITVQDDGCGMDAHTLSHAMDPFYSDKPAGRQVGMGLAKAQQLAAGLGGRVALRSATGQGTVATFEFPLDLSEFLADR